MNGKFDKNYGNWLPDEQEPIVGATCGHCGAALYKGEEVIEHDCEYYCDEICLKRAIQADYIIL